MLTITLLLINTHKYSFFLCLEAEAVTATENTESNKENNDIDNKENNDIEIKVNNQLKIVSETDSSKPAGCSVPEELSPSSENSENNNPNGKKNAKMAGGKLQKRIVTKFEKSEKFIEKL